jgi:sodium-dependent dicarboxylate transporter 2/3/5
MLLSQISGSSSAAFSIMFPLVFSMCDELGFTRSKMLFSIGLVSITTCATLPIGGSAATYAQYNGYLESFKITQYSVGFFDPMIARLPSLIAICIYAIYFAPKFCPSLPPVEINQNSDRAKRNRAPLNPLQEKVGYLTFIMVIAGMLLADTIKVPAWLITLIGALILTSFGVLSVKDVYASASMGGIVMMYVGVLSVGTALTNTGAGDVVGKGVASLLGNTHNGYVLGLAFFLAPFLLTQVMNNRAVSNIFIPITIMTCSAVGCNPVGPLMLTLAGALSAIMTPMATATVNMFMGLGGYDQKAMLKMSILPSIILTVVNVLWIMTIFPAF